MPYQAESTFVPVMPSFRGFGTAMDKGTATAAAGAGKKAGASFSKSFADSAGKDRSFEAVEKRIADTVSTSSKKMAAARTAEEDATRKARIEEQKLQELRDSGKAKASQLSAAEDRLVRSQRALRDAQDATRKSTQDYDDALERGTRELKDARGEAERSTSAFSRLGRSLSGVKGNLNFSSVGNLAKSGFSSVATAAAGVTLALGAAAGAGVAYGIKIQSGNEQAQISFTTMLGSARKADKFLRQLQQFAATTPFEFPELQTAASSLISAGIEADKVIPIMRTLGDVTSGMGTGAEGVQRATVALQQMSAAGRITGEDLNQLRDAGVPVFDLLAAATGKSKSEIVKLAQAGKLGKEELGKLMKALEDGKGLERFSGLMDKQSKSLAGLASTLKDTLGQGLANAVAPAFPVIKQGFGQVNSVASSFFGYLTAHKGDIASIAETSGKVLKSFGKIAGGAFGGMADSLGNGQSALTTFAEFLDTHQGDITGFFITGGHAAIGLGRTVAQVVSGALRAYAGFARGMHSAGNAILGEEARIMDAVSQNLGALGFDKAAAKAKASADSIRATIAENDKMDNGKFAADLADSLDNKLIPALDAADRGLTKVGDKQLLKANLRDQAAIATQAIKGIGTAADGSQIKLKKFSDISKLSTDQQNALKGRINDARFALGTQLSSLQAAGAGQKSLTKAWKEGKERLYDEFRQMGLSKKAAQDLADKYAGIKPKVQTKVTQPGMDGALSDTKKLRTSILKIDGRKVKITYSSNAEQFAKAYKLGLTLNNGEHDGSTSTKRATGGFLPGYTPGRDVHRFVSPTGGVLDLSGGEPVMRPEFGRVVGKGWVDGANAAARSGGVSGVRQFLSGGSAAFANGGTISTKVSELGLGLPKFDGLTNRLSNSLGDLLGRALGKRLDKTIGGGGNTGKALSYAKAHVGHPYQFGTIWDCSGFIGTLQNIAEGKKVGGRRYSTPAFHGDKAQGFTRGKKSNFMVGVNPNPGKSGHMAGTVNGVNVESAGGVGVRVGKSARGWNSGMFSWRGGLATGGFVPRIPAGDLPYDLLNPSGQRYDPRLRKAVQQTPLRTALFDDGGYLQPGLTLAMNGTGRPERIRTERQEQQVQQASATQPVEKHHHYHGPEARDLIRESRELDRVDDIMANLRGI